MSDADQQRGEVDSQGEQSPPRAIDSPAADGPPGPLPLTPLSFEQALGGLDDIVARLEGGEIGLEAAVGLFEQGQRYLAVCRERLDAAQTRIDELTAGELPDPPASEPPAASEPF